MAKLLKHLSVCCLFLITLIALREQTRHNITKTTPKPNLLNRFYQNDYKIAYEWAEVIRTNKRYGEFKINVFKYNRTCTASNATFFSNFNMGYNLESIVQMYKFASNEYRLFPLRFQFNVCEAITKESMGYDKFAKCGNFSCPIRKGLRYHYCNWYPEESKFPPYIPTGKYMVELQGLYRSDELFMTRTYASVYRPIPWE